MSDRSYVSKLSIFLVVKTFLLIFVILYAGIGLGPDEAQYWTWSRQLDWGYYSKPPGIAWQIWVGCQLFGNTELGVRFISLIFGILLSLGTYYLARSCQLLPRTAFWSGIVMAFSPLGVLGAFLAITDGGLALFWVAACIVVAMAISRNSLPNYYLLGLIILGGALFKWPIYLFWAGILLLIWFYRFLYHHTLFIGILISLLGLLPSVVWNYSHDWGTFRHVFTTINGGQSKDIGTLALPHGNFWDFIAAQAALLSPILFGLLIASFSLLFRKKDRIRSSLIFAGGLCFVFLITYASMAIFQKMQGNWASYVYSSGIVFLCWYGCERLKDGFVWIKAGVTLSIILVIFGFSIPLIQSLSIFSSVAIPYKINPFRQNLGWNELNKQLILSGYNPEEHFLFGDKYQMSSILSFYGPGQARAYFLNLQGTRHNQFSYWPSMAQEQLGKTGFFVMTENSPHLEKELDENIAIYQKLLSDYFLNVKFLGVKTLFMNNGELAKGALIYKCIEYNGRTPISPDKY